MEKRWKILLITSVGLFMASLDLFIVNLAFPDIAADFDGTSISNLSWVLNAYAITFAALLIPAGRWADRIGRKRVFITGLLTFALASAACAVAPSVAFLVGARIVQAIGAAMMLPSTLGLILPAFPPEQRPMAVGIWSAVGGVAAALGPPIGGLLVQLSWNWVFIVNVPIGLVTALIAYRSLDEVRDPDAAARPDLIGALELAAGLGLLTGAIVKGPDWGWVDSRIVLGFGTAVLLLAVFLRRSGRHPSPVIELPLFRVRDFTLGNAAALVFFAGFGAMLLGFVLMLTELWGYPVLKAGLALIPGPAMAALFAGPAGRLGGRIGQRPIVAAGGIATVISFAWALAFLDETPEYATAFLPGFMVGGVGVGLVIGALPGAVTAALPPERFATGAAVFSMARQLGAAIGVAILVALLADPAPGELLDGLRRGWVFMLGTGVAVFALALALRPARADAETRSVADPVAVERAAA